LPYAHPPGPPARFRLKLYLPDVLTRFAAAFNARRGPFAMFVGAAAVVAVAVAMLLPPWYRAQGTLLPPPENSDAYGSLAGLIQSSALSTLGLVTTSTTSDVFAEILRSRTLHEAAIQRFGLDKVYRRSGLDRTLAEFRRHLSVDVGRSAVISLSFEDPDARRAAEVANFLVAELDRFNREVYNTRAKRTRLFLESRLLDTERRLSEAQSKLGDYEKQHKVLAGGEKAAVEGAASVMAQKLNLQVRRSYVSEYAGENSAAVRELDAQLAALDREIARLPSLKMEGARLALEVEVQSKLFTLVSAQFEEARIQEARDTPTVTVLDQARPPELRDRPKRLMIVAVSVLAAFGLCALYTLLELRAQTAA